MNLLFSMSLAGSMVFLVYLILRPVAVRYFSSIWRYRLLKAALIAYLLPYQYLKYLYYDIFYGVFFQVEYQSPGFRNGFFLYDIDRLILVDSEGNSTLKNEKTLFTLLTIWSIAVLSFTIYQIVKYISCKRKLQRISTTPDAELCRIFDQCRLHVCMKRKVKLFCCSYINTPLTMGMFSPRIIMPESIKKEKLFKWQFHMNCFM